ncbi:MAG: pentapeptide repeat-containing protein [Hyphomicrobium sp.]|jgi:uncharacterized protein YjbI with pentapeptide repeats
MTRRARLLLALAILLPATVEAADVTVRDLTSRLYHAERGSPLQLGGLDLRDLDLSGLDFKGATLAASNLFGSDLSRADLSKANLKGARLDRVTIIGTRFDGADLSDTSFLRPATFSTLAAPIGEVASFAGANMRRTRLFGRFNRTSFAGADLSGAKLAPFTKTGFIEHLWRTEMVGADLSKANLSGADFSYTLLAFANLRGANLAGAILRQADLSRADLTGADLTGVDLGDADLDGAILTGTRGLDTALGLATARNVAKAIR